MGAKYLPTVKDLKLGQRFQRIQAEKVKATKPATPPPPKKDVKK